MKKNKLKKPMHNYFIHDFPEYLGKGEFAHLLSVYRQDPDGNCTFIKSFRYEARAKKYLEKLKRKEKSK